MRLEDWDEIHGFTAPGKFERFQRWIVGAIDEGVIVEVPVATPYSGSPMFDEHWYRARSEDIWRVVVPEAPFKGVFERVRRDSHGRLVFTMMVAPRDSWGATDMLWFPIRPPERAEGTTFRR